MKNIDRTALTEKMIRLADGDRLAFDFIFETARDAVYNFASRMVQSKNEADDITQNVLIKVFTRASEFRSDGDALSWIFGITAYECRTHRKKVERRKENFVENETMSEIVDDKESLEDKVIKNNLEKALESVLNELNVSDRETILTAIMEEARPAISPATFRKRLERAMARLKQKWRDNYEI